MSSGHSWGDTEAGSIHVLPKTQYDFMFEISLWKLWIEVSIDVVFPHLGSWWHTEPYSRFFPSSWGVLGCWGHFTHTAKVLWNRKRKLSLTWQLLSQVNKCYNLDSRMLTEHSSSEVCRQPERSLRTQQAEFRSNSRFFLISLCTWWSCRIQGENLAPRWIKASWWEEDNDDDLSYDSVLYRCSCLMNSAGK